MTRKVSAAEWRQSQWEGMSEKEFQGHVLSLAVAKGWRCYHTYDSRRSQPGFPDLVMVRGGRIVFAELKSERGKLSEPQMEWILALREVEERVDYYVMDAGWDDPSDTMLVQCWRPSDWPEIERILK